MLQQNILCRNKISQGKEKLGRDRAFLCHDRVGRNSEKLCHDRGLPGRDRAGHDKGALSPTIELGTHNRHARVTGRRAR